MDNKEIKSYFSKKLGLNRNGFARIVDIIAIVAVIASSVFFLVYLSCNMLIASIIITLAISGIFLSIFIKFRNKKLSKYIDQQIEVLEKQCAIEKLVLLSAKDFKELIKLYLMQNDFHYLKPNKNGFICKKGEDSYFFALFQNHYSDKLNVKEVLASYKLKSHYHAKSLTIISTSELSDEAQKFIDKISHDQINILECEDIIKSCKKLEYLPSQDQIDTFILSEIRSEKKTLDQLKKEVLSGKKIGSYIVIGISTLLWSYFTGFKFYYPIIALACFALAFFSFRQRKTSV